MEHGVGRQGPVDVDALTPQRRDRRRDHGALLGRRGAVLAGMRIEAGDGERGPRCRSGPQVPRDDARRPTIRSVVSACGTSRSGMCTVTGTTASASLHSIITGMRRRLAGFRRQGGQELGVAGMAEAGLVEHVLGDRVGHDGRRRAWRTSATAVSIDSIVDARVWRDRPARPAPRRWRERHDGKRPREDVRAAPA